jgi:predicted phosphodiesterase
MKYAIVGDVHGNLEAFTAVLADAKEQGVTHYACVGDVVGYNANPVECMKLVQDLHCTTVRGNHDHYCSHDENLNGFHPLAADAVDWTRQQLSDDMRRFLRNLRLVSMVESFTIVHSTLDMPEMWGYVFDKLEAEANFNSQTTSVCFFGHTHVPLAFEKTDTVRGGLYTKIKVAMGKKYFINVGSVGQPRDGDTRASCMTFNTETREAQILRVKYDLEAVCKKINDRMPHASELEAILKRGH